MTNPPHPEVAILNAALALPAGQRAAYLDQACALDAALRQRVEALLRAHEQAGDFLDAPLTGLPPRKTIRLDVPLTEKPGDKIGRYKLLQQIGEGGCGVVYMAEQEEPVRRRIALKVIKLGMDTKSVIARFEAERQALALMDHPNIAKVLDAGATDTGRPYFVMELVRGMKITDYCDQSNLSTRERLDLFVQICWAIQHAHQKGIIHRDIKPSNVLVTVNDGVPVPKVIDFGIAKATQGRLTDKTLFTAFEQFIGTPAYMSPEQAEMTSLDIDTRSDIYSLGVLLYELLTGKTPFDANELFQAGLDEMRRTIREKEPQKPSTRLSTMLDAERTLTAKHRQTESPKLIHLVRGDLDWIAMKCLEKDRVRRYETANGLAADIQRHLDNEPVSACPPSGLYRLKKAVRRNKGAFAAATAIVAVLLIGVAVSTMQAIRAKRAEREQFRLRQQAETEKTKAKTEATRSEQIAKFLVATMDSAGPSVARGRDATLLREILDKAGARIEVELKDQPDVQGDMWLLLGSTWSDISDYPRAITNLQHAVDCYRVACAKPIRFAQGLAELGRCQSFTGDIAAGKSNSLAGLELARKIGDQDVVVSCLLNMARSCSAKGFVSVEAEPYLREAVALLRQSNKKPLELSVALGWLSGTPTVDLAEAESLSRESLALVRKHLPPDHPSLAGGLYELGQVLLERGKPAEAEPVLRESVALYHKLYGDNHPYMPNVLQRLAQALTAQSKWAETEAILRQKQETWPTNPEHWKSRGNLDAFRGEWEAAAGQFSQALHLATNDGPILFNLTLVRTRTGPREESLQRCREFLKLAEKSHDPQDAEAAATAALLLPVDGTDFERACQLADFAANTTSLPESLSQFALGKALADFRRGRFGPVTNWVSRSLSGNASPPSKAAAWFIQASTYARLQVATSAQAALDQGKELMKLAHSDPSGALTDNWADWTIAELLLAEAEALIEGRPAAVPNGKSETP